MNFYISDMHYGHANILRLCNRPFSDVYEMNKALIQNWNSAVTPYDTVYIVGDVAWNVTEAIEFMHNCRGKKVLIVGNHDKKLLRNPDFVKCFDSIHDILEISDFGQKIVLFHYPMVEWNSYFRGSYLIYGHIHNNVSNRAYQIMKDEKRALNAGADITGFKPVNFETLIACNNAFNEKFGV